MIIRLTVSDNDFTNLMGDFSKNLPSRLMNLSTLKQNTTDEMISELNANEKIIGILNPNITEKISAEDEELLILKIRETFAIFAGIRKSESASYLINALEVKIIDSMEDKWENGEAWYWFQHSNTVINQ